MKAVLIILIFGIVFLALFANTQNSNVNAKNLCNFSKINNLNMHEQSFFAKDQATQIRNKIEFWEDSILIPEPIY